MEVVEHENDRPGHRHRLEEPNHRIEQAIALFVGPQRGRHRSERGLDSRHKLAEWSYGDAELIDQSSRVATDHDAERLDPRTVGGLPVALEAASP